MGIAQAYCAFVEASQDPSAAYRWQRSSAGSFSCSMHNYILLNESGAAATGRPSASGSCAAHSRTRPRVDYRNDCVALAAEGPALLRPDPGSRSTRLADPLRRLRPGSQGDRAYCRDRSLVGQRRRYRQRSQQTAIGILGRLSRKVFPYVTSWEETTLGACEQPSRRRVGRGVWNFAQDYSVLLPASPPHLIRCAEICRHGRVITRVTLTSPHAETRRTPLTLEGDAATLRLFKYSSSDALITIHNLQNYHI